MPGYGTWRHAPWPFNLGIAVQSGWGVDPAKMQTRMNLIRPGKYPDVPQGGTIWVFAVK
jgi:hypothetical protein